MYHMFLGAFPTKFPWGNQQPSCSRCCHGSHSGIKTSIWQGIGPGTCMKKGPEYLWDIIHHTSTFTYSCSMYAEYIGVLKKSIYCHVNTIITIVTIYIYIWEYSLISVMGTSSMRQMSMELPGQKLSNGAFSRRMDFWIQFLQELWIRWILFVFCLLLLMFPIFDLKSNSADFFFQWLIQGKSSHFTSPKKPACRRHCSQRGC